MPIYLTQAREISSCHKTLTRAHEVVNNILSLLSLGIYIVIGIADIAIVMFPFPLTQVSGCFRCPIMHLMTITQSLLLLYT